MKKVLLLLLMAAGLTAAQSLSGKKIALDPGHGFIPGRASDCSDAETKRFESYINHIVVPYLKEYLTRDSAQIITTRKDYDSVSACITLTERKAIANSANVDFFHSVHHNAVDNQSANYSLVLYKASCNPEVPAWPGEADRMAQIQVAKINSALQTTAAYPRGDMCFLTFNLGVLSTLQMPGTLSEASFYSNPDEKRRLANLDYLKTEAEALYLSFLEYYGAGLPAHGSLVGIVNNLALNKPATGVKVFITETGEEYQVDTLGTGFYRIDSLAPGTYTVNVYGLTDTTVTSVTVAGGKINVKNLQITQYEFVGDVALGGVLSTGDGVRVLLETPTGTVDSLHVYLSEDGIIWNNTPYLSVGGKETTIVLNGLEGNKPYYVRLKAANAISQSPNYSKAYGAFASLDQVKVLVVDGFDRFGGSGSWQTAGHNLAAYYGNPLADLNVRFETVSNEKVVTASQLKSYAFVIWFTGDESTVDETFSGREQNVIKEYLKSGGKLFVTGSEIAWDLDNKGTASDKDFINNYLKAKYTADNPTPNTPAASGVPGSVFDSLSFNFGQTYPEDWPDVIDPLNGSIAVLKYNTSQNAGVAYSGLFPEGTAEGKIIYAAFGIETIASADVRKAILSRASDFFNNITSIKENSSTMPDKFRIAAHPNPFNPGTKISVNIIEAGRYVLEVFNSIGEKVMTLHNDELTPGQHSFDLRMDGYSSGMYIVNLRSADNMLTQKIMLVK